MPCALSTCSCCPQPAICAVAGFWGGQHHLSRSLPFAANSTQDRYSSISHMGFVMIAWSFQRSAPAAHGWADGQPWPDRCSSFLVGATSTQPHTLSSMRWAGVGQKMRIDVSPSGDRLFAGLAWPYRHERFRPRKLMVFFVGSSQARPTLSASHRHGAGGGGGDSEPIYRGGGGPLSHCCGDFFRQRFRPELAPQHPAGGWRAARIYVIFLLLVPISDWSVPQDRHRPPRLHRGPGCYASNR